MVSFGFAIKHHKNGAPSAKDAPGGSRVGVSFEVPAKGQTGGRVFGSLRRGGTSARLHALLAAKRVAGHFNDPVQISLEHTEQMQESLLAHQSDELFIICCNRQHPCTKELIDEASQQMHFLGAPTNKTLNTILGSVFLLFQ